MKTNEDLQKEVMEAIKWQPLLTAAAIGVTAKNGIVTLTGTVDKYTKKLEAEVAAAAVAGVGAVVEEIRVKAGSENGITDDTEIAEAIISAFKWDSKVPGDKVQIKVEDGWVTLSGEVEWNYQKNAAKNAAGVQAGVRGINNNITVTSELNDAIKKAAIKSALLRNWNIDDEHIVVTVIGSMVTLNGKVKTVYEKMEAGKIAGDVPGVGAVVNELEIKTAQ